LGRTRPQGWGGGGRGVKMGALFGPGGQRDRNEGGGSSTGGKENLQGGECGDR
jgi:hypothetical protein